MDIVLLGNPEELVDHLEEAFSEPYEGFGFTASEPEALPARPEVRRVNIRILYKGRSFTTLKVEFAPVEAGGEEFNELRAMI